LKQNKSLTKLSAANNNLKVSRRFLALIGDLVMYHNRVLRFLILTCVTKSAYDVKETSTPMAEMGSNGFEARRQSWPDAEML
jgi:hypothetical protein